jgi:hypothetical protein
LTFPLFFGGKTPNQNDQNPPTQALPPDGPGPPSHVYGFFCMATQRAEKTGTYTAQKMSKSQLFLQLFITASLFFFLKSFLFDVHYFDSSTDT